MKTGIGKVTKEKDGFRVVFERLYEHDIELVWDAITNPRKLALWFTDMEFELIPRSKMKFFFRDAARTESYGEILRVEPPYFFSFTWETELAEWVLDRIGNDRCKVTLTYSRLDEKFAVGAPAGFHVLLDRLEAMLNGYTGYYPFGTEEFDPVVLQIQDSYGDILFDKFPELERYRPIIAEQTYNAPIDKVWKAITDSKQMKQWYFDIPGFKPEVGHEFQFTGEGHNGEKYVHVCKVMEVIPPRKLGYTWTYKGIPGSSYVTFELFVVDDKTRLKLTHRGVGSFGTDNPDFARSSFNQGWAEIIGKLLKVFVETKAEAKAEA